ncbi:MAG: hypothetical protein EPO09_01755 [Aquabacterium sp.]|nr:MAG: hypothetical protein EPO09_01755 [Aquabacterium sp.]
MTYRIPIDLAPVGQDQQLQLDRLRFVVNRGGATTGQISNVSGTQFMVKGKDLLVSKLKGSNNSHGTKIGYLTYRVKVDVQQINGYFEVKFTAVDANKDIPFDLMKWLYDPGDFSTDELKAALSRVSFDLAITKDVPLAASAVESNLSQTAFKGEGCVIRTDQGVIRPLPCYRFLVDSTRIVGTVDAHDAGPGKSKVAAQFVITTEPKSGVDIIDLTATPKLLQSSFSKSLLGQQ